MRLIKINFCHSFTKYFCKLWIISKPLNGLQSAKRSGAIHLGAPNKLEILLSDYSYFRNIKSFYLPPALFP
ncbi:20355_t:CDS:1, partial [Gigaspora rosea]